MRSAARSVSDRHRIADWVVPSWKAGGSVAEQCLRGFSRAWCRVQVGDTGYGGVSGRGVVSPQQTLMPGKQKGGPEPALDLVELSPC